MSDFALKVENAGKKFTKSLKRSMLYGAVDIMQSALGLTPNTSNLRDDEFWAVNDVSFEIKKGDCFGIIGPNGSGKTTLLKLLNGIFMPDKGKIEINGKIGALIQVGAGFHPLLSGRENIYINGAILGMTKKEIDKKFDEIVEFSEIEEFLDAPVKHYSSGMFVRLGFAIAVHCEPDILLIDEILAVGDRDFSLKCYQKINEIRKSGVSIILVSHNEYIIREQTSKCLYINKGYKRFEGPSDEGITLYIKESLEGSRRKMHIEEQESLQSTNRKCARIIDLKFYDKNKNEITYIETGAELNIQLNCQINKELENIIFGINFYGNSGLMYCANSFYDNIQFEKISPGKISVNINLSEFQIPTDKYLCSAIIADDNASNLIDAKYMDYSLVVGRAKNTRGLLKLTNNWKIIKD